MTSPDFHAVVAVWGEEFSQRFVEFALPSFLSPGNLPTLAGRGLTRLVCITGSEEQARLRSAPAMRRAAKLMEVRYLPMAPDRFKTHYEAMADAHHRAAVEAAAEGGCAAFLGPDIILADGTLAAAADTIAEGKRAVLTCGLRLQQETAEPMLKQLGLGSEPNPACLQPRALMRFALQHPHPEQQRLGYDSLDFTHDPVTVLWPHGEDGLLVRSFHLHPLMVDLRGCAALDALSRDTVDGSFIAAAFPDWRQIHIETDSDRILVFSLSPSTDRTEMRRRSQSKRMRLRAVAHQWNVNALHRWLFTWAIKLHAEGLDESWDRLEVQSGDEMAAALDVGALPWPEFIAWKATVLRERASISLSRSPLRLWAHRRRMALRRYLGRQA